MSFLRADDHLEGGLSGRARCPFEEKPQPIRYANLYARDQRRFAERFARSRRAAQFQAARRTKPSRPLGERAPDVLRQDVRLAAGSREESEPCRGPVRSSGNKGN